MADPSFESREFFHLTFLRHLAFRLNGRAYAVKGGICLRFFHGSPRLSEDMDLDVVGRMSTETLRNAVDTVLESRALRTNLASGGIAALSATAPKQTDVTQRWKVTLRSPAGPLPTKIEFSRRERSVEYKTGVPRPEILRRYASVPFAAQFYGAGHIARQKISALASPGRNAARDLFDLHHLLFAAGVDPSEAVKDLAKSEWERAFDKTARFTFDDFAGQVLPYLTAELAAAFEGPAAFKQLRDDVLLRLSEAAP